MGLRLLVAQSPAEREAARQVEAAVFLQAFGNTPELLDEEYGPYEARSRFVAVVDDVSGVALGTARLIVADAGSPVKTLLDVADDPWHLPVADSLGTVGLAPEEVWDVGSLVVDPRYRTGAAGAELSVALCHGLWRYARNCGAPGLVTIVDDRVRRLLRAMGVPWQPMPGAASQPYLGSPASTPCVLVAEAAEEQMARARPDLVPALVHGRFGSITLDPADLAPSRGALVDSAEPEPVDAPRRDNTGWRPPTARRETTPLG
ncbi:hypothetical protein [Blastococcus sp. SYSU DS0541]